MLSLGKGLPGPISSSVYDQLSAEEAQRYNELRYKKAAGKASNQESRDFQELEEKLVEGYEDGLYDVNQERTMPSGQPDSEAKPKGKPTKILTKDDDATRKSLILENESAEILAKNGYDIEQNPKLQWTTKKPDYLIEGEVFDNYAPSGRSPRNIASNIEEKIVQMQTERIVLNLKDSELDLKSFRKQLVDYPIQGLKEIIIIKDNQVIHFYPF